MYFLRDFPHSPNQTDGNPYEIQQKRANLSKLCPNCWKIPTPTTNEPLKPRQCTYLPTLHPLGTSISPSTTLLNAQNPTILLKNNDFGVKSLCIPLIRDLPHSPNQTDGNPYEIKQKRANPSKLRPNCCEIPTPTTN